MPLNIGAPIGSDAYTTAATENIYANTYGRATTAQQQTGKTTTSGAKKTFRYPLKRLEETSDYLEIKIFDYAAGEFKVETNPSRITSPTAQQRLKANKTNPKYYILLPIPQNISDNMSVTWGEDNINPLEAAGLGFAGDVQENGPVDAVQNAMNFLKSSGNKAINDPKIMKAIQAAISGTSVSALGGNVSAQGLISRTTGQVMNSNLELLFTGVNLRTFPFTFDLAPRSREEAQEVLQMIRVLKKTMTARNGSAGSGENSNVGLFINAPSIYQLTYKSGPRKHPFLNTFKPSALTDVTVNYTASGTYATYDDGTPVHMQLTLTFKELNPIYSEDYDSDPEAAFGVGY